jgi:RHS repeat-associated protein
MVARTDAGATWQYLYGNPSQQLQLTAAIEPDGTLDTLDYTDAGVVFSILRGATRYYVSSDQSGSPRVVSDAAGAAVKTIAYSAYGETLSDTNPGLVLPVGYGGGIPDPVTGLVHMGVRDYDPKSGRFTTRDPLLLGGGDANVYSYAAGDPIQNSDPLGVSSAAATLCEGICVGMKWSVTSDGLSACVETGVGVGNSIEIAPGGGLDVNKAYLKASAKLGFGPLANVELSDELSSDGHCRKNEVTGKACAAGFVCGNSKLGFSGKVDPTNLADTFKPRDFGVRGKAVSGVCQQFTW